MCDELICEKCGRPEKFRELAVYKDNLQTLCTECMEKLELVWDNESYEFTPLYVTCPDCGGTMTWCTCCEMYSQNCCVDYGTCQCS
jgi:hypothetical protein